MWLGVAGEVGKGDVRGWQVAHHLVATAHAADFAQLGNAIAVIVHTRIRLHIQHPAHHRVGSVIGAECRGQRLASQILIIAVQVIGHDVFFNFFLVIPHGDQVGHGRHLAVRNDGRVIKGPGAAVQQQLLGRHGHDADAAILGDALDLHIVQHGRRHHHGLARHRVHRGQLHFIHIGVGVGHHDLDLGLRLLHQHLQRLLVQPRVLVNVDLLLVLPPKFRNAALAHQRILEDGVTGQEPVVVVLEDVVDVICRLLGVRHILWASGHKLHYILGAEENTHQAGQHGAHRVAHLHGHHFAVALDLVAEQVATVILGALGPCGRDVAVDVADRIHQVLRDDGLQFRIIHGLNRHDVGVDGVGDVLLVHGATFVRTTYIESTARGVRRISASGNFSA